MARAQCGCVKSKGGSAAGSCDWARNLPGPLELHGQSQLEKREKGGAVKGQDSGRISRGIFDWRQSSRSLLPHGLLRCFLKMGVESNARGVLAPIDGSARG